MSRSTFDRVVIHLSHRFVVGNKGGIMKVFIEKQLLIFIRYASSQQTLLITLAFVRVLYMPLSIEHCQLFVLICYPILLNCLKSSRNCQQFFQHKGFPGVIGAIDGSHIPIKTPTVDAEQYFNRTKFPSIVLQAVCDQNLHFLDVFCGWPGSVHDSRVLKNSPLFGKAFENKDELFPSNTHLIGDHELNHKINTYF